MARPASSSRAAASTSTGRSPPICLDHWLPRQPPSATRCMTGRQASASRALTRWTVIRISEARTTVRRRNRPASCSAENPCSRVHNPTYGDSGAWACIPASRSTAAVGRRSCRSAASAGPAWPGSGRRESTVDAMLGTLPAAPTTSLAAQGMLTCVSEASAAEGEAVEAAEAPLPDRRVLGWEIWVVLGPVPRPVRGLRDRRLPGRAHRAEVPGPPAGRAQRQCGAWSAVAGPDLPAAGHRLRADAGGPGGLPAVPLGRGPRGIGFDLRRPRFDLCWGAVIAACVGGVGLASTWSRTRSASTSPSCPKPCPNVWWRIPVLVLSALQNALVEEVVVLGFLMHRLEQLGWGPQPPWSTSALSAAATTSTKGSGAPSGTP